MKRAIIGHAADKFTDHTESLAKEAIRDILKPEYILVSGGCHLGGIHIWAEEIAKELGCYDKDHIHHPKIRRWEGGYKQRNLRIAEDAEEVYVIVVDKYPPNYTGRRFNICYHCKVDTHIKSGACWTALKAIRLYNKDGYWVIISGNEE